ncbi:oxidoreductase [Mycobacterium nebraskense]|uniref:Oxidoreductase n=1 Tax=Mycobacterium nebraskense TaxID=244292 RepID=A0A1X1Z2I7_9MYCO|nr:FAD-binding oxidoreductase [Mycobacterium nebraskense]KKC06485.1 oxidoreductase [Mycobacterium nebraskense]MCV7117501.1 FAD-binding oxidoreductase [Mycobacterium nebraskense]ORW17558.1 oxidoreductase [Mycobacterium nebraskense]
MTRTIDPVPGFTGDVVYPDGADYDSARQVFNGLIDKRPGVVLRCRSRADIVAAVRYAVGSGAEIAVRCSGHSVAGHSSTDGGILIDLSLMRRVVVDPEHRIAVIEPGATWRDIDQATARHGLACPGGVVSSTGVGGFTLGGGVGWLSRTYGLTCDNLTAAELVLASGEVLFVSELQNPEILWGLRGGGGNFGVVAHFVLDLHPVDHVIGGVRAYDDADAEAVLEHFRAQMDNADDHLAALVDFGTDEGSGRRLVTILGCSTAAEQVGQAAIGALLQVRGVTREPVMSLQREIAYPTWQQVLDHTAPFGRLNYWKSIFLTELSDEAIRRIALLGPTRPAPQTHLHLIRLGGFPSRVPPEATAFSARNHPYIVHLVTTWTDPADTERCQSWTDEAYESLRPLGPASAYLNFVGDEGQARIRASFGEVAYRRLAKLKARLDPENRFALNQNIEPATDT